MIRRAILIACLALICCSCSAERDISAGVQKCHIRQVLHLTSDGRVIRKYDPARSFIPLGLWAIWADKPDVLAGGGFNTLVLAGWVNSDLNDPVLREKMMSPFRAAHVKLVPGIVPSDDAIRALRNDPGLLIYALADEPNRFVGSKDEPVGPVYQSKLDAQQRVHELDPGRATWVNQAPYFALENDIAQQGWWHAFNALGEVASSDCYPITSDETVIEEIARSVSGQVRFNDDRRPSFFVAQGHKDKRGGGYPDNIYPTPEQYRCEMYAAIVHGAVGLFTFKLQEDQWKAHPGIGPTTVVSTGTPEELAKQARELNIITLADARRSRELWRLASRINAEVTGLRQVILTPTANIDYHIILLESSGGTGVELPVRTLLKSLDGWYYLFAVNLDSALCRIRLDFPSKLGRVTGLSVLNGEDTRPTARASSIEDTLAPLAARTYKFRLR